MKKLLNYSLIPAIALLIVVSVIAIRCKKPTENISISVNTSGLFHYTALVQLVDNSGKIPSGLSVEVTGPDAATVYGLDGKKQLVASAGIIVAAIHPKMEPTASHPLTFSLRITGANYLPLVIPITITVDQKSQTLKLPILNLTANTPGVKSATTTAAAVNGVVTTSTAITTPVIPGEAAKTSITLPAGTQLQDANGNPILASSVSATVSSFAPSQAIDLFPGGSLASSSVVVNGVATSAVFIPAGFTNIDMSAGGTPVKKFSSPISVSMTLDPNFKDPTTGNTIAVGATLAIYSYSTDTGQWKFEQNGTVTAGPGGSFVLTFQTSHLTAFMSGAALAVLQNLAVNISAAWYTPGTTANIFVVAKFDNAGTGGFSLYSQTFDLNSSLALQLDGKLPATTSVSGITLYFYDGNDHSALLGTASITSGTTDLNVTLSAPVRNPAVSLSLQLDCRDAKQKAIVTPPDFYLLYKKTGTAAVNYAVLGQVHGGAITSTQLNTTDSYDFKAVFNDSSKEVLNHKVSATNSTTVGNQSFNGDKVPDANKLDIHNLCESLP